MTYCNLQDKNTVNLNLLSLWSLLHKVGTWYIVLFQVKVELNCFLFFPSVAIRVRIQWKVDFQANFNRVIVSERNGVFSQLSTHVAMFCHPPVIRSRSRLFHSSTYFYVSIGFLSVKWIFVKHSKTCIVIVNLYEIVLSCIYIFYFKTNTENGFQFRNCTTSSSVLVYPNVLPYSFKAVSRFFII